MIKQAFILSCLLLFFLISTIVATSGANNVYNSLTIDDVTRTIDATKSNIVRQNIVLKVVNFGEKPTNFFHLTLPKDFAKKHLSFLKVTQDGQELKISHFGYEDKLQSDALFYEVELLKAIQSKQKIELRVLMVLANEITTPFPKKISQRDNQKLLYSDNAYFYSPYSISTQKTTIDVGTTIIESFTNSVKPSEKRGASVVYGPYMNQKPFAFSAIKVHYQNNNPYVVVSKVERLVEVSHWGNIAVEEQYDVKHGGAEFEGEFSRSEYSKGPSQTSPATFRTLTAKLPPTAADIYFRDRIGNISTSTVRPQSKAVEVDFLPRFPLFGGWRIRFTIGYNLPTHPFLSTKGDLYQLKTKFSVPFDFAPVDDLTLKIVIPEGAQDVKVVPPFEVDSESREILKTYLDTTGRTVVVLKKTRLVPEHNQDVIVTYRFASTSILHEPLLVIGGLFAFCLFIMIYVRVDLTIQKSEAQIAEERELESAELVELYIEKQMQINSLYSSLESGVQKIRDANSTAFESALKNVSGTRDRLIEEINVIVKKLRDLNVQEPASKIVEALKVESNKLASLQRLATTKKAGLSSSKSTSEVAKTIQPLEKEYDALTEELNKIIDALNE